MATQISSLPTVSSLSLSTDFVVDTGVLTGLANFQTIVDTILSSITVDENKTIPWANVLKTGSKISDIASRAATQLTMNTGKILGRATAGSGAVEEITATSYGLTILSLADRDAARSELGVDSDGWNLVNPAHYLTTFIGTTYYNPGTHEFATAAEWAPNTAYTGELDSSEPSVVSFDASSLPYMYKCISSGTSGSTAPTLTGNGWGATITDGTVTWQVIGQHVLVCLSSAGVEAGMAVKVKYVGISGYSYYFCMKSDSMNSFIVLCGSPVNAEIEDIWVSRNKTRILTHSFICGDTASSRQPWFSTFLNDAHLVGYAARITNTAFTGDAYATVQITDNSTSTVPKPVLYVTDTGEYTTWATEELSTYSLLSNAANCPICVVVDSVNDLTLTGAMVHLTTICILE